MVNAAIKAYACSSLGLGRVSRNFSRHFLDNSKLPNREISRKYSKINPISRSPGFDLQYSAKESFLSFLRVFFDLFLPAHRFASCESSTVHGKCREQPSGDYRSISNRRVCDLLAFKVNASSCCYGIKLASGLADGVRKAVSKANADLAVARAEEHMMDRNAVLLELFIL